MDTLPADRIRVLLALTNRRAVDLARDAQIDKGQLSRAMNGKERLSAAARDRIAASLVRSLLDET